MGVRAFLSQLRRGAHRRGGGTLAGTDKGRGDIDRLAAYLRIAGLDELSALGGVHMQLIATGELNDLHAITRRMSDRLRAEGRLDSTAVRIRQAVVAARQAIGLALDSAPMQASKDLERHVLEATADIAAYVVIHADLDIDERRRLTTPYTDLWPELSAYLPGLDVPSDDIDDLLDDDFGDIGVLGSLEVGSWDDGLSALLNEAAAIETEHARAFESLQQFAEASWTDKAWGTINEAVQRAQLALAAHGRDVTDRVEEINRKAGRAASDALRFSAMIATEHLNTDAQLRADDAAMYHAGSTAIFAERAAVGVAARDLIDDDTFARLYFAWWVVMAGSDAERDLITYGLDEDEADENGVLSGWPLRVPWLPGADDADDSGFSPPA